jgi:hypothetical protein
MASWGATQGGQTVTDQGPGRWGDKTAFVMPVLPPELDIDPVLAALLHCMAFLELSEDDTVDPDWAVEAMEYVAGYLQRLPAARVAAIGKQLAAARAYGREHGAPSAFIEFVDHFLENYGAGAGEMS